MSLEEPLSHSEWIDVWKQTHANTWKRYSGNSTNEKLLLESVHKYRACETGCRRGFADIQSQLERTDGGNEESDRINAAQRKLQREAQLDAEVITTDADYSYAACLVTNATRGSLSR
jgi:hypothetical protein